MSASFMKRKELPRQLSARRRPRGETALNLILSHYVLQKLASCFVTSRLSVLQSLLHLSFAGQC